MTDRLDLNRRSIVRVASAGVAFVLLVSLASVPAAADRSGSTFPSDPSDYPLPGSEGFDGSYSYVRVLEGSATLIQGDSAVRDQLQVNQPLLVGDRIWVAPRGRLEVVLSDRNLLRVDAGSEVLFEALAGSPDRQDPLTVLRLLEGNVQLVVASDFLGEGLPRVDTPNATVYAVDYGTLRVTADGSDWTEVVAREGSAEVVTRNGSLLLREDERAIVEGERRPVERIERAGRLDALELWGARLDREARYAQAPYVDESIRYEAATLSRYGSWVTIDGRAAWRPRVSVEWRPYWHGRWSHSPLGYTWVSHEPWGWVPYHYGTWDYVPGYGWSWFPGAQFAPAWVYWYWTDLYAGWVPVGYYTRYYNPFFGFDVGFRFGTYGWAGGRWSHYRYWNFCDLRYLGGGQQHHHVYGGDRFGDRHGYAVPRRGLVTTDTRGLPSDLGDRRGRAVEILAARTRPGRGELPDVTSFVARERQIGSEIRERVLVDRRGEGARNTPILPTPGVEDAVRRARRPDGADTLSDSRARLGGVRAGEVESIRRTLPGAPDRGADAGRAAERGRAAEIDRGATSRGRVIEQQIRSERDERSGAVSGDRSSAARGRGDAVSDRSWRDRAPVLPDRSPAGSAGDAGSGDRSRTGTDVPSARRPVPEAWRSPDRGSAIRERDVERRLDGTSRDRPSIPRRVIEGVRDLRERNRSVREPERSPETRSPEARSPDTRSRDTRSRESSPPPRSRGSAVSDRSSSSRRSGASVDRRSSSSRGSAVSSRSSSRDRSSSVGSRSSSGRRSSSVSSSSSSRERSSSVGSRSSSGRRSSSVSSSSSSSRSRSSAGSRSRGSSERSRSRGKPPA